MDINQIFSIGNMAILPGWLALAFLPHWKGTQWISALTIPALISAAYAALIIYGVANPDPAAEGGGFGSIAELRILFASDSGLTAGWFHYLAFDMFVGAWEVREARRIGLNHLLVVPCLFLTLMLGPVGLLLFLIFRAIKMRGVQPPV